MDESCVCILEYPEERIGVGIASWLAAGNIENLGIYGTAQSLFVSPNSFLRVNQTDITDVSLWRMVTSRLISLKLHNLPRFREKVSDPYQLEINHFIKQIRGNNTSLESAFNALNVLLTCECAKESAQKAKRINISAIEQV